MTTLTAKQIKIIKNLDDHGQLHLIDDAKKEAYLKLICKHEWEMSDPVLQSMTGVSHICSKCKLGK